MNRQGVFTKVLAIFGTVLVWFPILMTVGLSVPGIIGDRPFRFDYLMPAELFPAAFVGGGVLLWAALRARSRRRFIGWGFGSLVGLLAGGQVVAVTSGLASGATEPVGWVWGLVVASIALYSMALIAVGTAGVLLLRDLFQPDEKQGGTILPNQ